jgi:putative transposase
LPGTTYLVTRRCARRQFFLKPSRIAKGVFLYVLAVAARRYGIEVHAYCVLSNHYHLVVTDPLAQLPAFQLYLDGIVARTLNALLGRGEDFWGPNSFSAVTLVAPGDIVDKAAYALANPVAAGLVRLARRWPGLWSSPELVGAGESIVRRPTHFFDPKGNLPDSIALQLTTPPGFPSAEAFREQLATRLAAREADAAKKATSFLGAARVLAQRATAQPKNREPWRKLNPRVAARDKWKRIEALGRLKSFLSDYRNALRAWREDLDNVHFPAGTYLMRVLHGAACAGAG